MEEVDLGVCGGQLFAGDPGRGAVLLPGAFYLPGMPLLWFAREALQAAGWTVLQVWDRRGRGGDSTRWAVDRLEAAYDRLGADTTKLVVAKSLTSRALPRANELGLPGIWLTPLLRAPEVRGAAAAATLPTLLAGGTADDLWDAGFAATLSNVEVLEFPGADHALQIPGDPAASLDILGEVVDAVDRFAGALD